ncbi:MAG: TolC family protein [bacterium]
MRFIIKLILVLLTGFTGGFAQLTLENCQEKALANYPLIKQFDLIKLSESYNLSNADKAYFPQLAISAKATYQSDVVEIPVDLPLFKFDVPAKDQYQVAAEISQVLWDGGGISAQKSLIQSSSEIEKQKLEADLYSIKDRINQLFFGILLIDEHLKRINDLQKELQTNLDRISSLKNNGVATQSDIDVIQVEIINSKQKQTELIANKNAFLKVLSIMTGEEISENTELEKPELKSETTFSAQNMRPELKLFETQGNMLLNQLDIIDAGTMPKVGLFIQGGYGRPGFNILKNEFQLFYIGGIRFSWNLSAFYSKSNSYELIKTNQNSVNLQKETFLFNNNLKTEQQKIEIEKLKNLIQNDDEIIKLRTNIKKTSEAKVENGTLSVSDLIRDINNENFVRLDKAVHEIQLLIAIYNYKYLVND